MEEILQMSALELSKQIRHGSVSVKEAVEACKKQIQKSESQVHAYVSMDEKILAHRIKEVEEGIKSGRYTGPLAGVPIAVKDNICTRGQKTTCSSKMLENFVPTYDAQAVKQLEDAGMVILGKTNMDEFAMGSTTETSAFGVTRNPWNPEHVPGGSSGGSCAAVAAGEAVMALGSDIPFFTINMVLCMKNFLMVFDQIMALTKGGPSQSTESISYLIYQNGMSGGQFGFQSANAVLFFVVIVAISAFQMTVMGKKEEQL